MWNGPSQHVVDADTIDSFKARIDNHWQGNMLYKYLLYQQGNMLYDYQSLLNEGVNGVY